MGDCLLVWRLVYLMLSAVIHWGWSVNIYICNGGLTLHTFLSGVLTWRNILYNPLSAPNPARAPMRIICKWMDWWLNQILPGKSQIQLKAIDVGLLEQNVLYLMTKIANGAKRNISPMLKKRNFHLNIFSSIVIQSNLFTLSYIKYFETMEPDKSSWGPPLYQNYK